MSKTKKLTLLNWACFVLFYLLFLWWHGAFEGPLSSQEIEYYTKKLRKINPEVDLTHIRSMLEKDNGRPIFMVNAIKLRDKPDPINGKDMGDNSEAVVGKYGNFVAGYLIQRGSYPVYVGPAMGPAAAAWGIDNGEDWTMAAVVRYRSLRTLLQMASHPRFQELTGHKVSAVEKTIAYPTQARLLVASLPILLFFVLLSLALGIQLFILNASLRAIKSGLRMNLSPERTNSIT